MIGTELLLGQIQDTNGALIARALAAAGIDIYWKTTVGDNAKRMCEALRRGLERSDAILCSGGLGPTADDITRECVAEVLHVPLIYHDDLYQVIVQRFQSRNRPLTENNKRQAFLPKGAAPIVNLHGTAPGLIAERNQKAIICMPGVPHELQPMLEGVVIPYLQWKFNCYETLVYRVLKLTGVGESRVDQRISDLIETCSNPTIGLLASSGVVRIRIAAKASTNAEALARIQVVEEKVRERLAGLTDTIEVE